jgi:hypothetical protein
VSDFSARGRRLFLHPTSGYRVGRVPRKPDPDRRPRQGLADEKTQHTLAAAGTDGDTEIHTSASAQTNLPLEKHIACDAAGAEARAWVRVGAPTEATEPEPTLALRPRRLPCARLLARTMVLFTNCEDATSLTRPGLVGRGASRMNFLHYELELASSDEVEVTMDREANVRLLDQSNYDHYRKGEKHTYHGGLMKRSPARLAAPSAGRWHLVIDLGGYAGTVKASVRIVRR